MKQTGTEKTFYTELAYVIGLVTCTVGLTLMEHSDCGVSMVVAPAYLFFRILSQGLPWFTFGMAEYTLQAVLLLVLVLVLKKIRFSWFFSFITAVFVGLLIDLMSPAVARLPADAFWQRLIWYLVGMQFCAFGIALMFRTYISPEVYELFVKLLSKKTGMKLTRFKTLYDCGSCLLGVLLSFVFMLAFRQSWPENGVNWGTVVCALVNGKCIGLWDGLFEKRFTFTDALPLRKYFEDPRNA